MNQKKSGQSSIIHLLRFLSAGVVAVYHWGLYGNEIGREYPMVDGWIFVELFFMLTGYYTVRHIEKHPCAGENPELYAVSYTVGKIKSIFPYLFLQTLLGFTYFSMCALRWNDNAANEIIDMLLAVPLNLVLVHSDGRLAYNLDRTTWFLCAMTTILPIFICGYLKHRKQMRYIASWMVPLIGYNVITGWHGLSYWGEPVATYINCTLRGICAISLGGLIYIFAEKINQRQCIDKPIYKWMMTVLELALYSIIFISAQYDVVKRQPIVVVCYMVAALSLTFSECTYSANIQSQLLNYLGRLSVPIYCLHWPVLMITAFLSDYAQWSYRMKYRGLILLTVVISADFVVCTLRKKATNPNRIAKV